MATISIATDTVDILETAQSPKEFSHLGKALLEAEKLMKKGVVINKGVITVYETAEDFL